MKCTLLTSDLYFRSELKLTSFGLSGLNFLQVFVGYQANLSSFYKTLEKNFLRYHFSDVIQFYQAAYKMFPKFDGQFRAMKF